MSDENHTQLTPGQLDLLDTIMHDPGWYMNGATMEKAHPLYYENWRVLDYCYFDLETNGYLFDDEVDKTILPDFRVLQFYGEDHSNRRKISELNLLINPSGIPIDPKLSEKVHGIYDEDVADAPQFEEVWPKIRDMLSEADGLIAFNGQKFDIPGLVYECVRTGVNYYEIEETLNKPFIDLLSKERERSKSTSRNKLADIAKRFGVKMMGRVAHGKEKLHDASVDVRAMSELMDKMSSHFPWTLGTLVKHQARYIKSQDDYYQRRRKKKTAKKESK